MSVARKNILPSRVTSCCLLRKKNVCLRFSCWLEELVFFSLFLFTSFFSAANLSGSAWEAEGDRGAEMGGKVNDIRKRERKKSERVGGGEGKGDVGVEGRWEEV